MEKTVGELEARRGTRQMNREFNSDCQLFNIDDSCFRDPLKIPKEIVLEGPSRKGHNLEVFESVVIIV